MHHAGSPAKLDPIGPGAGQAIGLQQLRVAADLGLDMLGQDAGDDERRADLLLPPQPLAESIEEGEVDDRLPRGAAVEGGMRSAGAAGFGRPADQHQLGRAIAVPESPREGTVPAGLDVVEGDRDAPGHDLGAIGRQGRPRRVAPQRRPEAEAAKAEPGRQDEEQPEAPAARALDRGGRRAAAAHRLILCSDMARSRLRDPVAVRT